MHRSTVKKEAIQSQQRQLIRLAGRRIIEKHWAYRARRHLWKQYLQLVVDAVQDGQSECP